MAVRFKFRSSVSFESIDLGGRPSISVHELRARIADLKKLKICADFDLILSDACNGQDFEDEAFPIPVGANVVIKRVPAGLKPSKKSDAGATKKSIVCIDVPPLSSSENCGINNFDDFGVDLCPNLDSSIDYFTDDVNLLNPNNDIQKDVSIRFDEAPCDQKIKRNNLCEDLVNIAGKDFRRELDKGVHQEEIKLENNVGKLKKLLDNAELPAELRCSLCYSIFEDAVMIPCCQHSFCSRCIAMVLVKQSSCPKCFSTKCTAKDILPNLSLRQAIEHFLEAQNAVYASYNNLPISPPDGESGIQTKEASRALSVRKQELPRSQSPSVTGMGSNHVVSESACESNYIFSRKEEPFADTRGGRFLLPPSKHKRHERNCYMCGSPDHLIRECPHANTGNGLVSGGIPRYQAGFWQGPYFSNVRPYANMYGTPTMIPFDPMMLQVPAFGFSSCMPQVYGGLPTHYGFMRMGATPQFTMHGAELLNQTAETMNKHNGERKCEYEPHERYHDSDISEDRYSGGIERSHPQPFQPDKGTNSENDELIVNRKHTYHKHKSPQQFPAYQGDKYYLDDEKHKKPHIVSCGRDQRSRFSDNSKSDLNEASNDSRRRSGSDCSPKRHHRRRMYNDDDLAADIKKHCRKGYDQSECRRKLHIERKSSHSSSHSSRIAFSREERNSNATVGEARDWGKERDRRSPKFRKI